jgi:hypothetical protein
MKAELFADERVAVLGEVSGTSDDGRGGVEAGNGKATDFLLGNLPILTSTLSNPSGTFDSTVHPDDCSDSAELS